MKQRSMEGAHSDVQMVLCRSEHTVTRCAVIAHLPLSVVMSIKSNNINYGASDTN